MFSGLFARGAPPNSGWATIANNTTLGLTVHVNSGLPANLRSRTDLNGDGQLNDRPIWVSRNSAPVGRVAYSDLKVERRLGAGWRFDARVGVSVKNIFNTRNVMQVNRFIATDGSGRPLEPIPASLPAIATYDARRVEIGVSVRF